MARLVHITSTSAARAIARGGIRAGRGGVIFFMPMIMGLYVAHQWARELKRNGATCFSAVYFQLPNEAIVWHGRYNETHVEEPLSTALARFRSLDDTMGYEFFCQGSIAKACIGKITEIRKPLGWRYSPNAHGRKPCFCPACVSFGAYKSSAGRDAWNRENDPPRMPVAAAKNVIATSDDIEAIYAALRSIPEKTRREDPAYVFRILELGDEILSWDGLKLIGRFAHPKARRKLEEFRDDPDPDVRELVNELLMKRGWLP